MVKSIEENTEYIRMNSQQIAKHLEHINWNLGKLVGILTKNPKLIEEIEKAEHERPQD